MYFSFIWSQLVFKPMSQVSQVLLIPQLIKRCFFSTFLQIFSRAFKYFCRNTCFQKINFQVPGCHMHRTGNTEVLTKCFDMQNARNTHIQWRRGSVSLTPVNSFSLLNTNYIFQNNILQIHLVKKSLGSAKVNSKITLMMMQCKTPNPSPLFSDIYLLLGWEHNTEKWRFSFLKMPIYLSLTFIVMQKALLFYP